MELKHQLEELNKLLGFDMTAYIASIRRGLVHNVLPTDTLFKMNRKYGKFYQIIPTGYTNGKLDFVHANAKRTGKKIFQSDKFEHMTIAVEHFERDITTRLNIGLYSINEIDSSVNRFEKVISLEFYGSSYEFDGKDDITLKNIEIGRSLESLFKIPAYKEEILRMIKLSHRNINYDIKKWEDDYAIFKDDEIREMVLPTKVTRLYFKDEPNRVGSLDYSEIHPAENSEYHGKILIFGDTSLKSILRQTELPDIIEIEYDGHTESITRDDFIEKYPEEILTTL